MQEVQAMCNRVIIINNGKIVADDSIAHLQQINSATNVLIITFQQPVNELKFDELIHVSGKESIGENKWRLFTDKPDELKTEVLHWSLKHGLNIDSLNLETHTLEDVFRLLTRKNG